MLNTNKTLEETHPFLAEFQEAGIPAFLAEFRESAIPDELEIANKEVAA